VVSNYVRALAGDMLRCPMDQIPSDLLAHLERLEELVGFADGKLQSRQVVALAIWFWQEMA